MSNGTHKMIIRDLTAYRDESNDIKKEYGLENKLNSCRCPKCAHQIEPGFLKEDHEGRLNPPTIREVWRCYDCGWRSEEMGQPSSAHQFATVIHRIGVVKITDRDLIL
jgi:hypothetical protein